MSLLTDVIFVKALRSNTTLTAMLAAGDVYNTSIAVPDEDLDNTPLPYVIVSYDGMQESDATKDDTFGSDEDRVQVSIDIVASTREEVGTLAVMVRDTIRDYFTAHEGDDSDADYALIPNCMEMSAGQVMYDWLKPGYEQVLTYQCDTNKD